MRPKRTTQTPVIDQNYLNNIYQSIVEKMQVLDKLNTQYKQKQQGHFLKTFMNVIQKMGSELILAQEAYRNVDLQARKDDYCLLLASQLRFFKDQTYTLQEILKETETDIDRLKLENGTLESQLASITLGFDMKVKECMKLRAEIRDLKRQIKYLSDPNKNSIFKFTNPEVGISQSAKKKSLSLTNYLEDGSLELYKIENRAIRTNNHNRKKNNSLTLQPKAQQSARKVLSKTPQNQPILFDSSLARKPEISIHSSLRRKLQNLPYNRNALQSYDPSLDH